MLLGTLRSLAGAGGLLSDSRAVPDPLAFGEPDGPPSGLARLGEAGALAQLPRLLAGTPRLLRSPRGDGSVVLELPGWQAPEESGAPIRVFLRRLGYDAHGWGLGPNRGNPRASVPRLERRVLELSEASGRAVALVGWSLGGVIAREVARRIPAHVRHVVTYGSPIVGGPVHTVAARMYGPQDLMRIAAEAKRMDSRTPIQVPITAIFSRRDGVVSWQACIDRFSLHVEHFEVRSPHLGLGIDPDVWAIAAKRLAG
jgi:pimeloyl-ACP methyl ester carboxylesterase